MTNIEQFLIQCSCGHEFGVRIFRSVNTQLSPEAVDDFLQGRLNRNSCPECGKEYMIPASVLFHDMERQFMVWVGASQKPDGYVEEEEELSWTVYARRYSAARTALVAFRSQPENATVPFDEMNAAKIRAYVDAYLRLYEQFKAKAVART